MGQNKKKYWLITTEYPPEFGGGIGTYCYHTARMMRENDWDVTVFIPDRNRDKDAEKDDGGIRILYFAPNRTKTEKCIGPETFLALEFSSVIAQYMKEEGVPEVLESQEYAGIAYYILQHKHLDFPLFKDLKILLTIHAPSFLYYDLNMVPSMQLPYFWIGEMERWCLSAADKINAPSQFIVDAVNPYLSNKLRSIDIVPLPFEQEREYTKELTGSINKWFFLGKLTPQKGIIPLLRAFRTLWNSGWNKSLYLIGGGNHFFYPERMDMIAWIKKNYHQEIKSKKLIPIGKLSPEKWRKETSGLGVALIPSIGDNYPYTVIEALAIGHLVLTSVQGGQAELIKDGTNGFLFDHSKETDLINKVKALSTWPSSGILEIRKNGIASIKNKHSYKSVYHFKSIVVQNLLDKQLNTSIFPFIRCISQQIVFKSDLQHNFLSIVVPFYNMGNYIEDTLISIFASEYKVVEVIVVNDGSNEQESKKLHSLQRQYNFKLIEQTNKGLPEARNTGAVAATGTYLAFLDADDKVHPSYFKKAIKLLSSKVNVHFVGCWAQYFEGSQAVWPAFTPEAPYLLYHNMINSSALVYRRDSFIKAGLNDPALIYGVEDWESVINMVNSGLGGIVIPETLWLYRVRKSSMARQFTREKLLFSYRFIAEKHSLFYSIFAIELTGLLNANGPGYLIDNPTFGTNLLKGGYVYRRLVAHIKRRPLLRKSAIYLFSRLKKGK